MAEKVGSGSTASVVVPLDGRPYRVEKVRIEDLEAWRAAHPELSLTGWARLNDDPDSWPIAVYDRRPPGAPG
jgi:hypothetical protein